MVRRMPETNNDPLPPPATTLEGREDQLTAQAYDLVEKRMRDGTASAQETVHFLRAGSRINQYQLEKLRGENEVLKARLAESEARRSSEDIYAKALRAFKGYSGEEPIDPEEFDDGSHVY